MEYALDPRLLPPGGVPVQCTRCSHVFIAAPVAVEETTQVFGMPVPVAPPEEKKPVRPGGLPKVTQVFGAVPQVPPAAPPQGARPPARATTQAFGAVPPVVPVAAQPGTRAPARPTQVFGAVPQVPPVAPVARPQGVRPPPQAATQAFGAVPQPPPTQTRGGTPPVGRTQVPGTARVQAAVAGPMPANPMPRRGSVAEPAPVGVAATTPIELPDEEPMGEGEISLSGSLEPGVPASSESAPLTAVRKPLELPPELLAAATEGSSGSGAQVRRPGSGAVRRPGAGKPESSGSRGLLILAGVAVLGLTAFLVSPAFLKGDGVAQAEVMAAREQAVLLLRRDDASSREEVLTSLRGMVSSHPEHPELLAELGMALAMHLDDTRVRAATLEAKEQRLVARIRSLSEAKAPADWQSRVNVMRDELGAVRGEMEPFKTRSTELAREAVQVVKQLAKTPEEESEEVSQARLRARGVLEAVMGTGEALSLAVRLAQSGQQDWSTMVVAEYVLTAPASPSQVTEAAAGLERVREQDNTFLRPYVLGARIFLMRKEPVAARNLLDTVITLNPKHELARQLYKQAEEMGRGE